MDMALSIRGFIRTISILRERDRFVSGITQLQFINGNYARHKNIVLATGFWGAYAS